MDTSGGCTNFDGERKYSLEKAAKACVTIQSNKQTRLFVVPELKTLALVRTLSLLQMKQETKTDDVDLKSEAGDESRK